MKLAIISDTHFGDPACGLVEGQDGNFVLNQKRFDDLKKIVKGDQGKEPPADFLVMVGDVFDFSIASYKDAYSAGEIFFEAVQKADLARDIIFIPGNHDGDFWHMIDYEINVIKKIHDGKKPQPLMRSVPAVIDDRDGVPGAGLYWIKDDSVLSFEDERKRHDQGKRDGLFLDCFFKDCAQQTKKTEKRTPCFWLSYPNLYLITPGGESVLITHGHYFETYWAMGGELALEICGDDLETGIVEDHNYGKYVLQEDMVGMNFPLSQLSCSGVGQAKPLTKVARQFQRWVKDHKINEIERYLNRLPPALIKTFGIDWYWGLAIKGFVKLIRHMVLKDVKNYQDSRDNKEFLHDPAAQKRIGKFYLSCLRELEELNRHQLYRDDHIPPPARMIYGHTHERTPWNDGAGYMFPKSIGGRHLITHNCGGWLNEPSNNQIKAEVFIYENNGKDKKGEFRSESIY